MPALNLPFQVIFIAYINIWPTEKNTFYMYPSKKWSKITIVPWFITQSVSVKKKRTKNPDNSKFEGYKINTSWLATFFSWWSKSSLTGTE